MRNPLRSEAEAYRFLLLTIGYFAAIVLASLAGNRWWGIGVFVVLTVAGAWWFLRQEGGRRPVRTVPTRGADDGARRILVIANETLADPRIEMALRERSGGRSTQVHVVAPALSSPLDHLTGAEDGARDAAQDRLDASIARLGQGGIRASGEIGDGEPLQAIEDALRTFGADEIVIATHSASEAHWLENGLVTQARERFAVPVTHVVVDTPASQDEI